MNKKVLLSGTGVAVAAVLASAVIILANTTFTSLRLDLTENKLFTLSEGTLNIIQGLQEPVTLDYYVSKKLMTDVPQLQSYANRVHDLLDEYVAKSNGNIRLNVVEPEPFSEEEDRAVAEGMQGAPINATGDQAYFGLVGTNSIDDQETIPFFQNNREEKLEYDLTKLIYNLANPEKRTIGVISQLPVFGNFIPGMTQEWAISSVVSEFFDVRTLDSALE
ncbi:MAG: GldG family protein, partial [Gammaproteobacteria bacterium]|nr:GldG family protein [Gammaproteobacteria bacterium]